MHNISIDDAGNRGGSETRQESGKSKPYELRYFARKHGLTTAQAADILRRFGDDRAKMNEAAVKLRRSEQAARS